MKFLDFKTSSKKFELEKEIHDYEDKKSEKILELGILAYEKIRKGLLDETLFKDICDDIKKIDLEIYNKMLEVACLNGHENIPICECGYISKTNEKFCPNCGNEIKKDKELILCDTCSSKIDSDSKFCACCGAKIIKKEYINDIINQ